MVVKRGTAAQIKIEKSQSFYELNYKEMLIRQINQNRELLNTKALSNQFNQIKTFFLFSIKEKNNKSKFMSKQFFIVGL